LPAFVVNDSGDAGDFTNDGVCETASGNSTCTLRAAIEQTEADKVPRVILVGSRTITLASELAISSSDHVIRGNGSALSILDGDEATRIFTLSGRTLQLLDVALSRAAPTDDGNGGALTASGAGARLYI